MRDSTKTASMSRTCSFEVSTTWTADECGFNYCMVAWRAISQKGREAFIKAKSKRVKNISAVGVISAAQCESLEAAMGE